MEVLPLGGLVDADIRVFRRKAEIAHMAEHVAFVVLRAGSAEIRPNIPASGGSIDDRAVLHRLAAHQDKSGPFCKSARLMAATSRPRARTAAVAAPVSAMSQGYRW